MGEATPGLCRALLLQDAAAGEPRAHNSAHLLQTLGY